MGTTTLFFIALGLSMDAFAVSISNGMCYQNFGRRQAAAVAEKLRGEHIERCVASPLIRASDTAGAAASA